MLLDGHRKELEPPVGLDPLDGKGHLLDNPIEKIERVGCGPATVKAEHGVTRAVVNGCVLVGTWADLADLHLHAVAGHWSVVAGLSFDPSPGPLENLLPMADKHAMDRVERQRQIVLTDEFVAELLDPELALAAYPKDQHLVVRKHLLGCQMPRPAALLHQPRDASGLIPLPPLA